MAETRFIQGNEAIARGAIQAGCRYFFGYPITPQSDIPEFMSRELPKVGGVFVQSESESGSIYMVYGGGMTGERVMTSTSSPGFSLMQEGVSYIAENEIPCVIVEVTRMGPGIGTGVIAYRRSGRGTKGISRAAKAHNANRVYATRAAALSDLPHLGDRSGVVQIVMNAEMHAQLFGQGKDTADLRQFFMK